MNWQINIDNPSLGGFAPHYYSETYPSYGNKNQAGAMVNIDATNAGYITQGPGLVDLTNGSQAGAVTTVIQAILDYAVSSDRSFAMGVNKLYEISSTTVTSGMSGGISWPYTIDKSVVTAETGEDICVYQGNLYFSYNHSGSAGDIGKYDLTTTIDQDWGSTVPTGAGTLQSGFHQMVTGGDDIMYIANGRYVATYNGTTNTLNLTALDLPTGWAVQSIKWMSNRLWIAADKNLIQDNKIQASIFVWDGSATSWESEIPLMGPARCLHVRNGVMYVFYRDVSNSGGFKLAYINGYSIQDLCNFTDGIPNYNLVTDFKDFIIFNNGYNLYAYGAGDKDLPGRLFQIGATNSLAPGAIGNPFGNAGGLLSASGNGSSTYRLAKFSGYTVTSSWKSLMFDITGFSSVPGNIKNVRINFEKLTSGARVDWKLLNNQGVTIYSDIISFAKLGAVTSAFYPLNGKVAENFRVEFDYANGSTSAAVAIKNVKINGSN